VSCPALGVDSGVLTLEHVAVDDATDVGRVPLLGVAFLVGRKELLADLAKPSSLEPELLMDWGDSEAFSLQLGRGECAA